jgi:glyoxylase I family protein
MAAMRVHHLAFRTADVPRLEAFYRDVCGLSPAARPGPAGESVWLAADATWVMLEPRGPGEPGVSEGSKDLVAFAIAADERRRFLARLARAGVPVEHETPFTLYFRDPDGRRVAVSHYPDQG